MLVVARTPELLAPERRGRFCVPEARHRYKGAAAKQPARPPDGPLPHHPNALQFDSRRDHVHMHLIMIDGLPQPGSPIRCTCATLRKAARRITQAYDRHLAPEGLKTSQYSILAALERLHEEPPTVAALADLLVLDRTTLGHNLRPLERAGLIRCRPAATDKRLRLVELTAAGRAKRAACFPLWAAAETELETAFGRDRAVALKTELLAVIASLPAASPAQDPETD